MSAIYWGMRSLMAEIPFDGRENLQEFFEKAKKSYEVVMKDKTDYAEVIIQKFSFIILIFLKMIIKNNRLTQKTQCDFF